MRYLRWEDDGQGINLFSTNLGRWQGVFLPSGFHDTHQWGSVVVVVVVVVLALVGISAKVSE